MLADTAKPQIAIPSAAELDQMLNQPLITDEFNKPLTPSEATKFRAVAARISYLVADRADLTFAA